MGIFRGRSAPARPVKAHATRSCTPPSPCAQQRAPCALADRVRFEHIGPYQTKGCTLKTLLPPLRFTFDAGKRAATATVRHAPIQCCPNPQTVTTTPPLQKPPPPPCVHDLLLRPSYYYSARCFDDRPPSGSPCLCSVTKAVFDIFRDF